MLDKVSGKVPGIYRLPENFEWECAASGGKREYPWPPYKGLASDKLANYGRNVGATTPVGRYPEGATPEGLMDMAGNVWEWMESWSSENQKYRFLRGGSWLDFDDLLRCSSRDNYAPDARNGFVRRPEYQQRIMTGRKQHENQQEFGVVNACFLRG